MTDPLKLHSPAKLLSRILSVIQNDIYPLSKPAMSETGTKLFGAAILHKESLDLVLAGTNHESASPLNHGETYTVSEFFKLPADKRPASKDCIFFSTHEPCSLCINAIVWSSFDNFIYLWDYNETDKLFGIPGDLDIWRDCFYHTVDGAGKVQQYKRSNPRFVTRTVSELIEAVDSKEERSEWLKKVDEVKKSYGSLSPTFRERTGC